MGRNSDDLSDLGLGRDAFPGVAARCNRLGDGRLSLHSLERKLEMNEIPLFVGSILLAYAGGSVLGIAIGCYICKKAGWL